MNIKAYIDYFNEISECDRSQQFMLLERAEQHANGRFGMPVFKLIATLIPICLVIIFVAIGYQFFSLPAWSLLIIIIIALLVSRVIVSELNARLLRTSLIAVLKLNKT